MRQGINAHVYPYIAATTLFVLSLQPTVSSLSEYAELRAGLRLNQPSPIIQSARGAYQAAFFPGKDIFQNRHEQQRGAFHLASLTVEPDPSGDIVGSLGADGPNTAFSALTDEDWRGKVNRAHKGDRRVLRDGRRLVARVDPRTGRIVKIVPQAAKADALALRPATQEPGGDAAQKVALAVPLPPNVTALAEMPRGRTLDRSEGGSDSGERRSRELMCLAKAVYFEARGEAERGQYAVAQVVMNRVEHPFYPGDICGVVFQNQHWRNRCQFSFACDGYSDRPRNKVAWEKAVQVAKRVMQGQGYVDEIGKSTHYHATYVRPDWIRDMMRGKRIGKHIFYRVRGWAQADATKS